ncbi:MAG: tripartite tricarboxylate transporter permease [Nanoarchaeota archaeon]|nr:tripartite tricarboxylate transporter permease [Nanoarchaeota archaeon]
MLELLLALAFGIGLGVVCGLLPGLHPNNTIPIILGLSFLFPPLSAAIVLISAGIVNSFVAFIPSILIGAPESESALSVLPGHRLLLQGRGYEALKLTVVGGFTSILFAIFTLPIFVLVVPSLYIFLRPNIHYILIFAVAYMIFSEKGKGKVFAAAVFFLSGILGYLVLDVIDIGSETLFPLLSGLFGLPMLLLAVKNRARLPETFSLESGSLGKREVIKPAIIGSLAGMIAGLLPGIGSSQATVLAQAGNRDERTFLMAIAGVNVVDIMYSILALWLIGNPRSGIAVAVGTLVNIDMNTVLLFLSVILAAAGAGAFLTLKLSRAAVFAIRNIDYQKLCLYTLVFICVLVFAFAGFLGLAVAGIALSIGLIPNLANIRRSHAMGCLILPTVLFFMGFV